MRNRNTCRFKYECNEKLVDTSSETPVLYNLDKLFEVRWTLLL